MQKLKKDTQVIAAIGERRIWFTKVNDDVWQCRIGFGIKTYSTILVLGIFGLAFAFGLFIFILGILAFIKGTNPFWGLILGLFFMLFGAGMTRMTIHSRKKARIITMNRNTGDITVIDPKSSAGDHTTLYRIQDFTALRLSPILFRNQPKTFSTHLHLILQGPSSSYELFLLSPESHAREHCKALSQFLNLPMIDDTRPYDISDVLPLLNVDDTLKQLLAHYTPQIKDLHISAGAKITDEKLNRSIADYANYTYTEAEEPLLLIEPAWITNERKGALITSDYLYTLDRETRMPLKFPITGLSDIRIYHRNIIYLDGEPLLDLGLSQAVMHTLAQLLKAMALYATTSTFERNAFIAVSEGLCTVNITFGDSRPQIDHDITLLVNPDFAKKNRPLAIEKVYLDTSTCDRFLLEKFLTYIVNHPPKKGLKSVRILYQGSLDDLGENLKNALRNTFAELHKWE